MNDTTIGTTSILPAARERIEAKLAIYLQSKAPQQLTEAMQYAVLNGGKRLRPLLVYATGYSIGAPLKNLDIPAAAVELIHCYSLVHDDLPAMDDDDLRRGQPSCHKKFDEATAILVGDALQSLAFSLLAQTTSRINPTQQLTNIKVLAEAIGAMGMVGGQSLDLQSEGKTLSLEQLIHLHQLKTGALIKASVRLGSIAADFHDENAIYLLEQFALKIGLAFQIQDDILDVEGNTQTLGKQAGSDAAQAKATFPSLLGLDTAKSQLDQLLNEALSILDKLPFPTQDLAHLAKSMTQRTH